MTATAAPQLAPSFPLSFPPAPSSSPLPSAESFQVLGLREPLLRALAAAKHSRPTPIQANAIPPLLAGHDLLGIAETGTGKTAAFALPLLQILSQSSNRPAARSCRALILAPTRELALQIGESLHLYGRFLSLRHAVVVGGVGQLPQVRALARGVDLLVATPGRLIDLMEQGHLRLDQVSEFVLDEADRMLDMGFARDLRRILKALPRQRHSLLFSATMPAEVAELAQALLHHPLRVEVAKEIIPAERIEQWVFHIEAKAKRALLIELLAKPELHRVIVFTRTKHGANRVAEQLAKEGIAAGAIHGNKSQGARQRALLDFREGRSRVLVATDIAARGLDIPSVSHVINYELPNVPESYVHRIGRTARAGQLGVALSFCDASERSYLKEIERMLKRPLQVRNPPPALLSSPPVTSRHPLPHSGRQGQTVSAAKAKGPRRKRSPLAGNGKARPLAHERSAAVSSPGATARPASPPGRARR